MGSLTPIQYWNVNVPAEQHTPHPPPFLETLSPKDLVVISTPDTQYTLLPWPSVQALILANRIDAFHRLPSDLRRYLEFTYKLKQEYGSVMEFMLRKRLGWAEPLVLEGKEEEKWEGGNVKVLWNDWPYGLDERIVHLVIWTKFELEDDPATNDLTPQARAEIDNYVNRTFVSRVGKENAIWFKNWRSLKSVQAVEHFHVMLYDPDPAFVDEITGGDVPLSRKV